MYTSYYTSLLSVQTICQNLPLQSCVILCFFIYYYFYLLLFIYLFFTIFALYLICIYSFNELGASEIAIV